MRTSYIPWNDDDVQTLYWVNMLNWIYLLLAHWNNSLWVNMLLHSDTWSWLRANQSLHLLITAACLLEKQQIPFLKSLVWPNCGPNQRSTALEASTWTITHPMCFYKMNKIYTLFIGDLYEFPEMKKIPCWFQYNVACLWINQYTVMIMTMLINWMLIFWVLTISKFSVPWHVRVQQIKKWCILIL